MSLTPVSVRGCPWASVKKQAVAHVLPRRIGLVHEQVEDAFVDLASPPMSGESIQPVALARWSGSGDEAIQIVDGDREPDVELRVLPLALLARRRQDPMLPAAA